MIHIENTPWFVCKKDDTNFCSYIDTDSNYYNAEPLLRHLYPDFDNMSEDEKDSNDDMDEYSNVAQEENIEPDFDKDKYNEFIETKCR
jgi:hypothetical protein